jgi:hypothetical protein
MYVYLYVRMQADIHRQIAAYLVSNYHHQVDCEEVGYHNEYSILLTATQMEVHISRSIARLQSSAAAAETAAAMPTNMCC